MNRRRTAIFGLILLAIVLVGGTVGAARSPSYAIDWLVLSAGGAPAASGEVTLSISLGQVATGLSSSSSCSLGVGYWYGGPIWTYYLPIIVRAYSTPVIPPPEDKPDLVIRDLVEVDGNANPNIGEIIHMRLRIKNQGNASAWDIRTSWRPKGEGDGEVLKFSIDRLDPGEDHNFYWDYVYNTSGEFATFAKVDFINSVDESDEDNNTETYRITVDE